MVQPEAFTMAEGTEEKVALAAAANALLDEERHGVKLLDGMKQAFGDVLAGAAGSLADIQQMTAPMLLSSAASAWQNVHGSEPSQLVLDMIRKWAVGPPEAPAQDNAALAAALAATQAPPVAPVVDDVALAAAEREAQLLAAFGGGATTALTGAWLHKQNADVEE